MLVALIVRGFAGSQNDKNASQPNSPLNTFNSAYQDIAWGTNVQKHLKILNTDLDGVSSKLQDAQKEWRMALQDYNSAGQFLLQGANEAKNGIIGTENFQRQEHFAIPVQIILRELLS